MLGVVLVVLVVLVGPDEEPWPPELALPPEPFELVFPLELVLPVAAGVAVLLATGVADVAPLLAGAGAGVADGVALLLGVPALELLPEGVAVYDCPATPDVAGCASVVPPLRCAKS